MVDKVISFCDRAYSKVAHSVWWYVFCLISFCIDVYRFKCGDVSWWEPVLMCLAYGWWVREFMHCFGGDE